MSDENDVLNAYHRKIARHEQATSVRYPFVRLDCVDLDDQTIVSTDVWDPELLARFRFRSDGRVIVQLV